MGRSEGALTGEVCHGFPPFLLIAFKTRATYNNTPPIERAT